MASYISGITDFVPQLQPFKPDFGSIDYFLKTKESQYQQGYQKLSGIYGSLLNSPMLRDSDIQRRDDFFKKTQENIQKISEQDLSLNSNVQSAMQVFEPLINDTNIASDMAYTKQYYNELSHADSLRNTLPPKGETTTGYWSEGVQDLNNWAQDYSKSDDQLALQFSKPRYTPYINPNELAQEAIKGMGFKTSGVSFMGTKDKQYIVTSSNGTRLVAPLHEYLKGIVGADPRVQDVYAVKARLSMRNQVDALTPQFGGNRDAAEDYYLKTIQGQLLSQQAQSTAKLAKHHEALDASINTLGASIPSQGVKSDNPLIQSLSNLLQQKQLLNQATQVNQNASIDPQTLLQVSRISQRDWLSKRLAYSLMNDDMGKFAQDYSAMTAQSSIKVDPYAEANFKDNLKRSDMMLGYQIKSALQKEKQGVLPASPGQGLMFPVSNRDVEKGNFGPASSLTDEQDLLKKRTSATVPAIENTNNQVYKQLANYAVNSIDPSKKQNALDQLKSIYGDKLINELQARGPLTEHTPSESAQYSPSAVYNSLQTHWNDKLFRQSYNDIITASGAIKGNADLEFSGLMAVQDAIKKNNNTVNNYIYSQDIPLVDKRIISSMMGYNGELLTPEQYQGKMKGIMSADAALKVYDKYHPKYLQIHDSPEVQSLLQPVINPLGTTGTGAANARTMHGTIDSTIPNDQATSTIETLGHTLNNYQPFGITQEVSPTADAKVFSPSDPAYTDRMNIIKAYLTSLQEEKRKKPSSVRTTNGADVWTNTATLSGTKKAVTLSVPQEWFNKFNSNYKGATGTKSPNGLNWKDFQNITVLWDKDKAPPEIFDKFNWGPADIATLNGKTVNIDAFPDVAAKEGVSPVSIYRDANKNLIVKLNFKQIGPDGKMVIHDETVPLGIDSKADDIYNKFLGILANVHNVNSQLVPKSPAFQGGIKNLPQAVQYLSEQETPQEDANESEEE